MVDKNVLLTLIQKYGALCRSQGAWETLDDLCENPYQRSEKAKQAVDDMYGHIVSYIETGDQKTRYS
jgi:hypothetical protein